MQKVGKREFTLHTSKYLRLVEERGEPIMITHHNHPVLKVVPSQARSIRDLAGTLQTCKVVGNINEPVLPGYDQW